MICPKCGKELEDDVKFCSKCGASFEQKKKKGYALLIITLLSAVLMIGVLIFLVLKSSGEEEGDNEETFVEADDKENEDPEKENEADVDDMMNRPMANTEFVGNTLANLHNGGDVVSDGENVYFYEFGCIYKLDKAGNVEKLYTMSGEDASSKYSGWSQLQIQDGILYFKDNCHVVAYDLSTSQYGYLLDAVDSFVVDEDYVYYTTRENYNEEIGYLYGTLVIAKYSFAEGATVERFLVEEDWANTIFVLGKSPVQESEILIAHINYVLPEDIDIEMAENSDVKAYLVISSTDFKSLKEETSIEFGVYWGLSDYVKSKNYLYLFDRPEDLSMGYYESREYLIPEVISEDDWQDMLDKVGEIDARYVQYISDYYTKYDINNWRQRDEDKKEAFLDEYPILSEKVIYVLRPHTQNNVKLKFEEVFAEAGITDYLMAKSEEMVRDRTTPKDYAHIRCVNLQTMKEEYRIQEKLYLYHILGAYENDLIIYAIIDDVSGIYRITEKNLWECGLNGKELSFQLILETQYGFGGRLNEHMDIYVVDDYLYYRYKGLNENIPVETSGLWEGRMQRIALTDTGVLGEETCGEVLTDSLN